MAKRIAIIGLPLLLGCSTNEDPSRDNTGQKARISTPISGGTLAVGHFQGRELAVASDPERGGIWVVDVDRASIIGKAAINPDDEPGRVALSSDGLAHVVLRRGGALLTLQLPGGTILERRAICPAPRGVDVDPTNGDVYVACQTGEVVRLPARGEAGRAESHAALDLRDVVLTKDKIHLSTFRQARLWSGSTGDLAAGPIQPAQLPGLPVASGEPGTPSVAWRMKSAPSGGLLIAYQQASGKQVPLVSGGYTAGDRCRQSIVRTVIRVMNESGEQQAQFALGAVLPVDLAMSSAGDIAIVAAGASPEQGSVLQHRPGFGFDPCSARKSHPGKMVAVAYSSDDKLLVQGRDPAALYIEDRVVTLTGIPTPSAALDLFHTDTGAGIACASCHPEGLDDGVTWAFIGASGLQHRRTMPLNGGILRAAPFHWSGDLGSVDSLIDEVMVKRMGGASPDAARRAQLALWLDALPPYSPPLRSPDAVGRGRAIFERADVGCAECHNGEALSSFKVTHVGTGNRLTLEAFKTPSLRGIAHRAPYMHNGCAPALRDRFYRPGPWPEKAPFNERECSGGELHGKTAHLADSEIDDLVAYLESL